MPAIVVSPSDAHLASIEDFINRWQQSGAAERANFQSFAKELCKLLSIDEPEPAFAEAGANRYCFEYPVKIHENDGIVSQGFIDLYKRDCFVMEAKQGSDQESEDQLALFGGESKVTRKGTAVRGTKRWSAAMQKARLQAERYAKASDGHTLSSSSMSAIASRSTRTSAFPEKATLSFRMPKPSGFHSINCATPRSGRDSRPFGTTHIVSIQAVMPKRSQKMSRSALPSSLARSKRTATIPSWSPDF